MKRSAAPSQLAAKKVAIDTSNQCSSTVPSIRKFQTPFKTPVKVDNENRPNVTTPSTSASGSTSTLLSAKRTPISLPTTNQAAQPEPETYWNVCYGALGKKKKPDDGVLIVRSTLLLLKDSDGKDVTKQKQFTSGKDANRVISEGEVIRVGGKECEVMSPISEADYQSGTIFLQLAKPTGLSVPQPRTALKAFKPTGAREAVTAKLTPLYDPNHPDAFILHQATSESDFSVAMDPWFCRKLRPHQKEGIKFLFENVIVGHEAGHGAILADEMGLGKTIQAIGLIWTALKTGTQARPSARKVIVITPTTLVQNWLAEFRKWLGKERLDVFLLRDQKKSDAAEALNTFKLSPLFPVMVISYEQVRAYASLLAEIPFDLMICDEGHRLKNSSAKISLALRKIATPRRVILSGTPVQNDLEEFYAMVDAVNPGFLGSLSSFKHGFVNPILEGQEPNASANERELGRHRTEKLAEMTSRFILRRTADLNQKYLPERSEQIIICRLGSFQSSLYSTFLKSRDVAMALGGDSARALSCITCLKKLCNYPGLIAKEYPDLLPADFHPDELDIELSGKLEFLHEFLQRFTATGDKVVLVSSYTKTLDVLARLCARLSLECLRLDGSTSTANRQNLVNRFNLPTSAARVFLLSTKAANPAGGVGLNLVGANRLVLFDSDWNPANDRQAMARVWRDGQAKKVWVYRLLACGTIEEKIFQRQLSKQLLSDRLVDDKKAAVSKFSKEALRDIFSFNTKTVSDTHDLLRCDCLSTTESHGQSFDHFRHFADPSKVEDSILKDIWSKTQLVTFAFERDPNAQEDLPEAEESAGGEDEFEEFVVE